MATFKHIDIDGTSYDLPDVSKTQKGLCPQLPNESTTTKYLRQDGTWVVPPNTTYSVVAKGSNGLCPALPNETTTTKYLRQDGTWVVPPNTTYSVVSKTANGLCPQLPNETTTTKYLRQDGTWVVPPNTTYGVVTTSANGLCPTLAGGTTKYLRADGTWVVPPNTTYSVVSKTANGLCPQLPNETTTTKYLRQDGTWSIPPDNNTTTGTTYNAGSAPANTTFGTNGSIKNVYDAYVAGNIASITRSGTTFTAKNSAGTQLFTFTQQDNNTTYGVVSKTANGLCPQLPNESTTTKYLRQDGTWSVPPDNNTTTGTTYTPGNVPANTTFGTNGSIKNVYDTLRALSSSSFSVAGIGTNVYDSRIVFTDGGIRHFQGRIRATTAFSTSYQQIGLLGGNCRPSTVIRTTGVITSTDDGAISSIGEVKITTDGKVYVRCASGGSAYNEVNINIMFT